MIELQTSKTRWRGPKTVHTVLCAFLLLAGAGSEAQEPLAELVGGAASEVRIAGWAKAERDANNGLVTARYPLRLRAGVDPVRLDVALLDVRLGAWRDQALADHFQPRFEHNDGSSAILVDVQLPLAFGTYSLAIDLVEPPSNAEDGPARLPLDLELTLPEADLVTHEAVTLRRVRGLWNTQTVSPPLELHERSGRSVVEPLTTHPRPPLLNEHSVPTSAALKVELPASIAADGSAPFTLELIGEPPLGSTTAQVEIRAPQLAEPVAVAVTVLTRRSGLLLCILIVLGVLLGVLVRKVIAELEQRSRARLQARKAISRLRQEIAAGGDAEFLRKIQELAAVLDSVLESEPAKVGEKIPEIQGQLEQALDGLDSRWQTARQQHADLVAMLRGVPEDLPPDIHAPIEQAHTELAKTAKQLTRSGFESADATRSKIKQTAREKLRKPIRDFAMRAAEQVLMLRKVRTVLLANEIEAVPAVFAEVDATAAGLVDHADDADLGELLQDTEDLHECWHRLAFRLVTGFTLTLTDALARLETLGETAPTAALRHSLADYRKKISEADSPELRISLLVEHAAELDARLRAAILTHVAESNRDEVETDLDAGHYFKVIAKLEPGRPEPEATKTVRVEGLEVTDAPASVPSLAELIGQLVGRTWRSAGRRQAADDDVGEPHVHTPKLPVVDPRVEWWRLLWIGMAKNLFALAVIVLAGYFLFEETWVGTGRQMLGVFAWAFGLDLGVDKAFELATGVYKPQR